MKLASVKAETIEEAFRDFHPLIMESKCFRELFDDQDQVDDFAFRYGGEEFLILLSNISLENTQMIAERIRQQVEVHHIEWQGNIISLSLSVGALFNDAKHLHAPIEFYIEKNQSKSLSSEKIRSKQGCYHQLQTFVIE